MEMTKNLFGHIRRWSYWRKRNVNGTLHHILVLFGIVKSPTFASQVLPEEIEEIWQSVKFPVDPNTPEFLIKKFNMLIDPDVCGQLGVVKGDDRD